MRRPWKERVWFYKPEFYWYSWRGLKPIWFGDDEFHWKTIVIGWNPTGQIVIALRPFKPKECEDSGCSEFMPTDYPGWPITVHDWPVPFDYGD